MKCRNHPKNDVVGYCSVCGDFGCPECLTSHERQLLCAKHYAPIQRQLDETKKSEDIRKRHPHQRLVVRYRNGRILRGVCYALNIRDNGFKLDVVDDRGVSMNRMEEVEFRDIKAVFFVHSFDGKSDTASGRDEWTPEGQRLILQFEDGETLKAFAWKKYDNRDSRFYVVPEDRKSNNISVLVEASALTGVFSPEEYATMQARQKEEQKKTGVEAEISQEETTGDFYFATKEYLAAYEQYSQGIRKFPHSARLRGKMLLTQYNIGVHCIRMRQYRKALSWMEAVLKTDPKNVHALKKAHQLKKVIEQGEVNPGAVSELEN